MATEIERKDYEVLGITDRPLDKQTVEVKGPDIEGESVLVNGAYVDRLEIRLDKEDQSADRLYRLLGVFDTRDGSIESDLIRAAREGAERSGDDMDEDHAWDEFDRLIEEYNSDRRKEI